MASIFTKIIKGEINAHIIAEDKKHLAFLDINPLMKGHSLVIPKKEVDYIFDLGEKEIADLFLFVQKVAKGIKSTFPCNRIGITVIGLEVSHAHVHLIPINKEQDMNFSKPKLTLTEADFLDIKERISKNLKN